ncbi:MAG: 50S ribosomal protein L11 methyltransferase [Oscillospiraceae bacterium]|nr:50S ribosomal protein L11 methyltransferase [Oscillospiraceae bacterium]
MDWTEIKLTVPLRYAEQTADIANMVVPYGIYIEDYSDLEQGAREIAHIDLIDRELLERDRSRAIVHVYINPEENPIEAVGFLGERLAASGIEYKLETDSISEDDWANNWKKYFKPLKVGWRLLICPTWEEVPPDSERAVLRIDPGMAFGTGGHETTRLVLETLERYIKGGETMLDVGCGSGILSVAARMLGAKSTVGVDIDPLAVKTAVENGLLNGLNKPDYTVIQGDLVDKISGRFDVVAANIVADAIIELSASIVPFITRGGVYIASGIIDTREEDVTRALESCGLKIVQRDERGGWVVLVSRVVTQ